MKREDIIDALEYIDEEYIEEADRSRSEENSAGGPETAETSEKIISVRERRGLVRRWGTFAASFAVMIIAALVFMGILRTRNLSMDSMKSAEIAVYEEEAAEERDMAEQAREAGEASMAAEPSMKEEPPMAEEQAVAAEPPMTGGEASPEAVNEAAPEEYLFSTMAETEETAAAETEGTETAETEETAAAEKEGSRIRISSDAGEVIFVLNDTPAAESLLSQLPLTVDTEPYSDNEIVFHPEVPLDVENGMEGGGSAGYLGYFAPWDNIVMYYGDFEAYPELYILGEAVSGAENIQNIKGRITVSAY